MVLKSWNIFQRTYIGVPIPNRTDQKTRERCSRSTITFIQNPKQSSHYPCITREKHAFTFFFHKAIVAPNIWCISFSEGLKQNYNCIQICQAYKMTIDSSQLTRGMGDWDTILPTPWHTSGSSSLQWFHTCSCLSCTCEQSPAPTDHRG